MSVMSKENTNSMHLHVIATSLPGTARKFILELLEKARELENKHDEPCYQR